MVYRMGIKNIANNEVSKIHKFTDLIAWQEGHKLVVLVYKITKDFPPEERYCLVDQMRRAVVSFTSNIAEGFSRRSVKEKYQFYSTSKGSMAELKNLLLIARDVGYISQEVFSKAAKQSVVANKLLTGLLQATRLKSYES